jgi:hypothetical protein
VKIDQVIAAVITVRDQIDAIKKKHKEELAPLNSNMEKLEAYIHLQLQKAGVNSMAAKNVGTAFLQNVTGVTVEDWDATLAWIKTQESWEFLEHRVSKSVVQDYMESTGEVPPGVRVNTEVEVRVRRG